VVAVQLSLLETSRLEDPAADDGAHVARVADSILADLGVQAPVRLEVVASYQGIGTVVHCSLPNAGCLVTDPQSGAMEIRLRSSDHPRRQRFSGFHEVAHTFMPGYQLQIQWRCDPPQVDRGKLDVEALCDIGAGELLLPRRLLSPDLAGAEFGVQTLCDVADAYDASLQASGHRFVDLWPEDAMFVVLEIQNKPTERSTPTAPAQLRVSYAWTRGDWPFIRRYKSVGQGDPLARALEGELVDERTTLTTISAHDVAGVHVSARYCPFVDAAGIAHHRVLALYRRVARTS
jgi:hypothetical protein